MSEESQSLPNKAWARVRAKLRQEFGESVYRSWFKPLILTGVYGSKVELSAPTTFMQERIEAQYSSRIKSIWILESGGSIKTVGITVLSASSSENVDYNNNLELEQDSKFPLVSRNVKVENPSRQLWIRVLLLKTSW